MLIIVVDEFDIVFLGNPMTHHLIIDDCCHSERSLLPIVSRVGLDFSNAYSSAILDRKVESLILSEHSTIDDTYGVPSVNITRMIISSLLSQRNDIEMLLMSIHCILSDKDLLLCLRLELDINIVLGVEHLPSDFAGKVIFNHLIDYREALVYGHHIFTLVTLLACILEILRHEFGEFLIGKVVL